MEIKTFIPGSEWIYFKIYTGTKTADSILKNDLHDFVREMMENGSIDKWFFIRYTDPDFHIRLRLHLKEERNFTCIFNSFFIRFLPNVNDRLVWNIQCDTYQRELERYGANTISIIEDLFFIDSEFSIKLLQQLDEANPEDHRWKLALILIDSFLSAFSIELKQRKELLSNMAANYKNEFGFIHHNTTKQLNDKYRIYRKEIENSLLWKNEASEIIDIIKDRSKAILSVAEKLISLNKSDKLQVSLVSLLADTIHMTMNRWFRKKNRLHEMVIYEFLSRYYASEIAKNQYS